MLTMPKSLYLKTCILSVMSVSIYQTAQAQEQTTYTQVLDPIVVVANRTPVKTSNVIAQTRVIDAQELQKYQGQTVFDVLKNLPNISIKQSGGMGTASNFYIRGYDSKQVLVLIDGVPYGSLSTGAPAISLLPVDQIERIEVLYGASGASLYGSNAMGGVIQIFSKGQNVQQTNVSATAGFGSHQHYQAGVTGQFKSNNSSMSLGVSHNKTNGFNAIENADSSLYNLDKDGFKQTSISLAASHDLSDQLSAGISALYGDSTTEYDNGKYDDTHADQKNGAMTAYLNHKTETTNTTLSYGYSLDKSANYGAPNTKDQLDTKQQQVKLQSNVKAGKGSAILGLEWLSQNLDTSNNNYQPDDRKTKSAFLAYQLSENRYDLMANYRVDDASDYGTKNTYGLGGALKINDALRIGTNYATAFRAPSYNELYFPNYSNPDLKPETSKNTEAFIEYHNTQQNTRLTAYQGRGNNLIAFGSDFKPYNINKYKIQGVSLTSDWMINNWMFGLGYEYLDSKIDSGVNQGKQIAYRPKNKGTAYLGYLNDKYDIRLEAQHVDKRYISDDNTASIDGYTLLNLDTNYYINPSLRANLRINNLTNEKYTLTEGFGTKYATDGVNAFGSLTYTWR